MMSENRPVESDRPVSRPFGVWALTTLNLIVSGILPIIIGVSYFVMNVTITPDMQIVLINIVQSVLGLALIWTSIGAWWGKDSARKWMLIFIVIFHSLQIISHSFSLFWLEAPPLFWQRFLGGIVQSLLWIGLNVWYFRRTKVLEWYRGRGK